MNIEILPYSHDHAAGVRDLIVPIQREEFGIDITYEDQPDLHDVEAFYRGGGGDFWVAVSGAQVVGSIALIDIGDGQGALRKMFVRQDFRGAGSGGRPAAVGPASGARRRARPPRGLPGYHQQVPGGPPLLREVGLRPDRRERAARGLPAHGGRQPLLSTSSGLTRALSPACAFRFNGPKTRLGGKGRVPWRTSRPTAKRLWGSLMEMARIGATKKGGVCRLALDRSGLGEPKALYRLGRGGRLHGHLRCHGQHLRKAPGAR